MVSFSRAFQFQWVTSCSNAYICTVLMRAKAFKIQSYKSLSYLNDYILHGRYHIPLDTTQIVASDQTIRQPWHVKDRIVLLQTHLISFVLQLHRLVYGTLVSFFKRVFFQALQRKTNPFSNLQHIKLIIHPLSCQRKTTSVQKILFSYFLGIFYNIY